MFRPTPNSLLRKKLQGLSQRYQEPPDNLLFVPSPLSHMPYDTGPLASIPGTQNAASLPPYDSESHTPTTWCSTSCTSVPCYPKSQSPVPEVAVSQSKLLYYQIATSSPVPACPRIECQLPESPISPGTIPGKDMEMFMMSGTQGTDFSMPPPPYYPMPPSPMSSYPMPPSPMSSYPMPPSPLSSNPNSPSHIIPHPMPSSPLPFDPTSYLPPYSVSQSPLHPYPVPPSPIPMCQLTSPLSPPYPTPPSPVPPFPIPTCFPPPYSVPENPMPSFPAPPSPLHHIPFPVSPLPPFSIPNGPVPPPSSIPRNSSSTLPFPSNGMPPPVMPLSSVPPCMTPAYQRYDSQTSNGGMTDPPSSPMRNSPCPLPASKVSSRALQHIPIPTTETETLLLPNGPIPESPTPDKRPQGYLEPETSNFFGLIPVSPVPPRHFFSRRRKASQTRRGHIPISPAPSPTPGSPIPARHKRERSRGRELIPTSPIPTSPFRSSRSRENTTKERTMPVSPIPSSPYSSRKGKDGATRRGLIPSRQETSSPAPVSCSPIRDKLLSGWRNQEGWNDRERIPKKFIPGSPAPPSPTSTSPIPPRLLSRRRKGSPGGRRETSNSPIPPSPLTSSSISARLIYRGKESPVGRKYYSGSPAPPSPTSTSPIPARLLSRRRKKSPGGRMHSPSSPRPASPLRVSQLPTSPVPVSPTPTRMTSRRRKESSERRRRNSSSSPNPSPIRSQLLLRKKKESPNGRRYSPASPVPASPLSTSPIPARLLSRKRRESPSRSRHSAKSPIPPRLQSSGRESPARSRLSQGSPARASPIPKSPNPAQKFSLRMESPDTRRQASKSPIPTQYILRRRKESPDRRRRTSNSPASNSPGPAQSVTRQRKESPSRGRHFQRSPRPVSPLLTSPMPSCRIQARILSNGRTESPTGRRGRQNTDSPVLTRPIPGSPSPYRQTREGMGGRGQIPIPSGQIPNPGGENPIPDSQTPIPINKNLIPTNRNPIPSNQAPIPSNQNPIPTNQNLIPTNQNLIPTNRNPIPANQNPIPTGQIPIPISQIPSNSTSIDQVLEKSTPRRSVSRGLIPKQVTPSRSGIQSPTRSRPAPGDATSTPQQRVVQGNVVIRNSTVTRSVPINTRGSASVVMTREESKPLKPVNSASDSASRTLKPVNSASDSASRTLKPVNSASDSASRTLKPVNSATNSALSAVSPASNITKPVNTASNSTLSPVNSASNIAKPVNSAVSSATNSALSTIRSASNSTLSAVSSACSITKLCRPTSLPLDQRRITSSGLIPHYRSTATITVKSCPKPCQSPPADALTHHLPGPSPDPLPAGVLPQATASLIPEPDADPQGSSVKEVEEVPAEGSVRAEPIVAVTQAAENQSTAPTGDDVDADVAASTHAEASFDTGGGGSVSVATCEHRFSSTGGAPPPYSRLPPDGHEFPSNYAEGLPDKMSRYARYSRLAMELDSPGSPPPSAAPTPTTPRTRSAPGTPLGPPPPIPRSSSSTKTYSNEKTQDSGNNKWAGGEERRSREPTPTRSRWRRQDERSERSVRDKIAMFSTDGPDQPHPKTRKLDKQEGEEGTMKRSFTEDDVRLDNSGSSSNKNGRDTHSNPRSLSKTNVFSSMINVSTSEPKDNTKHISTASSEVDIRQETPPTPRGNGMREEKRPDDESSASGLHSRSQSLIDIGRSSLTKRHSVGAYDRPSVYQYGIEKPEERERRTSLTNLIEQRRKSFGSKLLGLVIPESRGSEGGDKASIDLPRISSVPPTTASKTMSLPREGQRSPRLYKADSISSIDSCESNTSRHSSLNAPPWKSHGTSTLPKYSPAFKRKNMTVFSKSDNLPPPSGRSHSACSSSPTSDLSQPSPTPMSHSPPKSLENISPPSSEHTYDMNDGRYNSDKHSYSKLSLSQKNSLESRLNRAEDSDNDSAVSSTQSSYSQGMSPPSSPMPEQDELEDRRGRGYRSRLSQQNSLDEQEAARRVLKRGSIEAENRRNVINSARVSSGRNSDEHQTPEIIRKYSSASDKGEDSDRFPQRLDTELRDGPKVTGLRRQASTSSTSSTASSRRSSHDSSRRNSRDSVIHVTKHDEAKVSAEPVYFDQEGEMYKESQLKVAYVNEITDDYEQLNDANAKEVIAEVPLSSPPSRRTPETKEAPEANQTASSPPRKGTNRWAKLEMKYGSNNTNSDIETKIQRMRRASDSSSPDRTKKKSGGFRALAEKWQQRAEEDTAAPPHPTLARRESNSRLEAPVRASRQFEERAAAPPAHDRPARPSRLYDDQTEVDGGQAAHSDNYSESTQSSSNSLSSSGDSRSENLDIPRAEVPDRKLSMPEYGSAGVKMRDRREGGAGGAPSRPTSLIEGGDGGVMDSHYLTTCSQLSPAASTDSRDDLFTPETSLSRTASKEVLDAFSRPRANIGVSLPRAGASSTPKMADIMRAFERHDLGKRGPMSGGSSHLRMSSMDSTNSDEGLMGAHYGSVTSLASGQRDQYGSITSLASSTSLISPQELAQLIEEANQSLEESGTPSHEILVVVLHREVVAHGSIGITLAGGADYEAKEITVHKVIPGSLADRDGRIQRGDRVLSINGKNLRGVTHKEALSILKSPRPEVVLVLSRSRSVTPQESNMTESDGSFIHRPSLINHVTSPRPPKILESPMDSKSLISDVAAMSVPRGPPFTITLVKDGAGLGFSLEGGKDSPLGDRPLTVKKIFSGGAADKGGVLKVGDELVSVNTVDVTGMARIEAWNFLKKLPDGTVTLVLRQKLDYTAAKNEE